MNHNDMRFNRKKIINFSLVSLACTIVLSSSTTKAEEVVCNSEQSPQLTGSCGECWTEHSTPLPGRYVFAGALCFPCS